MSTKVGRLDQKFSLAQRGASYEMRGNARYGATPVADAGRCDGGAREIHRHRAVDARVPECDELRLGVP
jgi:hypothetical protein